jgi:hypothetical protein
MVGFFYNKLIADIEDIPPCVLGVSCMDRRGEAAPRKMNKASFVIWRLLMEDLPILVTGFP